MDQEQRKPKNHQQLHKDGSESYEEEEQEQEQEQEQEDARTARTLSNRRKRKFPQIEVTTIHRCTSTMNSSNSNDDFVSSYDIANFPDALLLEILARMPVKSVFRFRCVCKHWCSIISHVSFSRFYSSRRLQPSSFRSDYAFRIFYRYIYVSDFRAVMDRLRPDAYDSPEFSVLFLSTFEEQQQSDQFKVLAASNGLILCCLLGPLVYYVCDPVTRQWVTLPRGGNHATKNRHPLFFGEGFVSRVNTEDSLTSYRVVRIEWLPRKSKYLNLESYSSETGEWVGHRLIPPTPVRLLKRGGGPIHFNGILHWFVYDHGMIAFDPYVNAVDCRIIQFPEDRDVTNEHKYDGLYRLCDECQGKLRYFEVSPEAHSYYCFSMWELKDYENGKWCSEFKVSRSDLCMTDPGLSSLLMDATFVPLAFHPFDLNVVYLRCVEHSCIVSYNIRNKRVDVACKPIGVVEDLSWRVVMPYVLPMWPTPVPLPLDRPTKSKQAHHRCSFKTIKRP